MKHILHIYTMCFLCLEHHFPNFFPQNPIHSSNLSSNNTFFKDLPGLLVVRHLSLPLTSPGKTTVGHYIHSFIQHALGSSSA